MMTLEDIAPTGWRVHEDPEIEGYWIWVHDVPGTDEIVLLVQPEEGDPRWAAFHAPASMEDPLHGFDAFGRDGDLTADMHPLTRQDAELPWAAAATQATDYMRQHGRV